MAHISLTLGFVGLSPKVEIAIQPPVARATLLQRGKTLANVRAITLIPARRSPTEPAPWIVALPGLAPLQAPQSAHREDDGEERGHAEREERPDEEEGSAGVGDAAADADPLSHHMNDGDDQRKERPEEDDDVPRSPFGEHQRSVQPDDQDWHRNEVQKLSRLHPADDVISQV